MAGENSVMSAQDDKIHVDRVEKRYQVGDRQILALRETSLQVKEGEFICLVGPTGCGKTTLLNMIAGLESVTSGKIVVSGKEVHKPGRDRGVVFQQYALFPWLTVRKNVEFALSMRGIKGIERSEMASEFLSLVNLKAFENALPKQLSGGMKQRVALARAYAAQPDVLLMDEPFGALDADTKSQLQEDLLSSWRQLRTTVIFITHDVEEAVFLAQRVIVMAANPGRVTAEVKVDLPILRDHSVRFSSELLHYKNDIWNRLHSQRVEDGLI
ncbi:ABC transporter ATP-binding protein [Ferroacidibacillus organovorans]|uniref:ABC transporter domain-containing protein n=1 Tax=Ferroacidibacillus organovorans TaxID=1765683 RepID=A0A101XPV3_9BACL|nr:ABC transporter ATP-binding protein [Ferroacidibacillus organovorans]KUO95398.1 hypothetical protein ATW55_11135 [Ferroacidibacillus organovorans]